LLKHGSAARRRDQKTGEDIAREDCLYRLAAVEFRATGETGSTRLVVPERLRTEPFGDAERYGSETSRGPLPLVRNAG